jgi:hypothetical protein
MRGKLAITAAVIFGLASSARANPTAIGTGFSPPEFFALLAESLLVAIILFGKKFDFVRVLYTWFLITLITYWLMMAVAVSSLFGLTGIFPEIEDHNYLLILALIVFSVLEVCVVFVEAWCMRRLSRRRFFHKDQTPLTWKYALLLSLCGNVVSLLVGFAWLIVI